MGMISYMHYNYIFLRREEAYYENINCFTGM